MLNLRVRKLVALLVGLVVIAPFMSTQEAKQSEHEAMYQRYAQFASYVKGGSIEPHWMAGGNSFWYAEGVPENTIIWKIDLKYNTKTPLFDPVRLRGAIADAMGTEPGGKGMPFRDFEFLTGETAARFRLEKREFVLDLADYTVKEDSGAAQHKRERLRPRVVGRGFGGDILEVLSPDRGWFAGVDKDRQVTGEAAEGTEATLVPAEPEEPVLPAPVEDDEFYRDVPSLVTTVQIREAIEVISLELQAADSEIVLVEGHNGWRLASHPRFARWVRLLRNEPPPVKLSPSSLETLAVIAYRQPVTRAEIEQIRGVSADAGLGSCWTLSLTRASTASILLAMSASL